MKKLILSCFAATLLFSCKKNEDTNTSSGLGNNQFKIGSTTYTGSVVAAVGTIGLIEGSGTTAHAVSMAFIDSEFPTTGGTFKIVASEDFNAVDEVTLSASDGTKVYTSTTGGTIAVTVSGGKISAKFTDVTVKHIVDDNDVTKISANIVQP